MDSVELWEMRNPNKKYFDDISVHEAVNKDDLFELIILECGDMTTVDDDSRIFYMRVKNFFKIHKWNIDRLAETTLLEYNPINDFNWVEENTRNRDQVVDTIGNKDVVAKEIMDDDWSESGTDGHTNNMDYSDISKKDGTKNVGYSEYGDSSDTTTSTGHEGESSSGTDVHYVSAFNRDNDNPNRFEDVEQNRDTTTGTGTKDTTESVQKDGDYSKNGNNDETSVENNTGSGTENNVYKGEYEKSGTDDYTKDNTSHEDSVGKETLDENIVGRVSRSGVSERAQHTYQSLIEEERKQAEFNIYKWILRHWCKELMIGVM